MALRAVLRTATKCSAVARGTLGPVLAGSAPGAIQKFASAAAQSSSRFTSSVSPWLTALAVGAAAAPIAYASSNEERSFIMIKPDGVHRGLISEVIQRFERKGYKLVGIKVLVPSEALAGRHYIDLSERPFYPKLCKFLSSGPVIAMVWEGKEVIKYGRTLIGATNPLASPPGTIRGDFGIDVGRNVIHGSDSVESAQKEIALWFDPLELASYDPVAKPWIYE